MILSTAYTLFIINNYLHMVFTYNLNQVLHGIVFRVLLLDVQVWSSNSSNDIQDVDGKEIL